MGKKSRLKRERAGQGESPVCDRMRVRIEAFLAAQNVDADAGEGLKDIVSKLVNIMISRSIKEGIQLPSVRPAEDKDVSW